jgi:hypothetical protein
MKAANEISAEKKGFLRSEQKLLSVLERTKHCDNYPSNEISHFLLLPLSKLPQPMSQEKSF